MKLHGKTLTAPKPKHVPIVREDGDFVFVCGPVLDFTRFEQICPEPKPPVEAKVGEAPTPDLKDRKYLAKMEQRAQYKMDYLYLTSINHTPGLEWDTVVENDPATWANWEKELLVNCTEMEVASIKIAVTEVNMTSDEKRKEALTAFFRRAEEALKDHQLLGKAAPASTAFGEPANA